MPSLRLAVSARRPSAGINVFVGGIEGEPGGIAEGRGVGVAGGVPLRCMPRAA